MGKVVPNRSAKLARTKEPASAVEDHLKDLITRGLLVPGQRVTESELMADTGASRGTVREAFQRLAVERIMTIEPFRGASVKRFSQAEMLQLYDAREVLEGLGARLAAMQGSAKLKNNLIRLMAKMESSVAAGDWLAFTQINNQWHKAIADGCQNTYVSEMVSRLNVPVNRHLMQSFLRVDELAMANKDHRKITQAVVDGAADAAEKLMRKHVRSGFKRIRITPQFS